MFFGFDLSRATLPRMFAAAMWIMVACLPVVAQGNGKRFGPPSGAVPAVAALSAEEARGLALMREEEKLARDLYTKFAENWNLRIFARISESEQRHFDAVGRLLARYNIEDPARDLPEGVFRDASLQALYDELLAKGGQSIQDALEVGLLVEQRDIADLENTLLLTANADVKRVLTSLLSGSMRHLDSFEECLEILNP